MRGEMIRKIFCFVGLHKWEDFCENIFTEGETIVITIGFKQCMCGKSKLEFIYGSKK